MNAHVGFPVAAALLSAGQFAVAAPYPYANPVASEPPVDMVIAPNNGNVEGKIKSFEEGQRFSDFKLVDRALQDCINPHLDAKNKIPFPPSSKCLASLIEVKESVAPVLAQSRPHVLVRLLDGLIKIQLLPFHHHPVLPPMDLLDKLSWVEEKLRIVPEGNWTQTPEVHTRKLGETIKNIFAPIEKVVKPIEEVMKPVGGALKPLELILKPIRDLLRPLHPFIKPFKSAFRPTTKEDMATASVIVRDVKVDRNRTATQCFARCLVRPDCLKKCITESLADDLTGGDDMFDIGDQVTMLPTHHRVKRPDNFDETRRVIMNPPQPVDHADEQDDDDAAVAKRQLSPASSQDLTLRNGIVVGQGNCTHLPFMLPPFHCRQSFREEQALRRQKVKEAKEAKAKAAANKVPADTMAERCKFRPFLEPTIECVEWQHWVQAEQDRKVQEGAEAWKLEHKDDEQEQPEEDDEHIAERQLSPATSESPALDGPNTFIDGPCRRLPFQAPCPETYIEEHNSRDEKLEEATEGQEQKEEDDTRVVERQLLPASVEEIDALIAAGELDVGPVNVDSFDPIADETDDLS